MTQRIIDLSLAVLGSIISLLLSWPYWRDYEYWPESRAMWVLHFIGGFVLAVYVFYLFLICMRTLFVHDTLEREASSPTTTGGTTLTDKKEGP